MSNTVYGKPLPSIHVVRKYYEQNGMTETRGALLESRPRNNRKLQDIECGQSDGEKDMVSNAAEYDSESLCQSQINVARLNREKN